MAYKRKVFTLSVTEEGAWTSETRIEGLYTNKKKLYAAMVSVTPEFYGVNNSGEITHRITSYNSLLYSLFRIFSRYQSTRRKSSITIFMVVQEWEL